MRPIARKLSTWIAPGCGKNPGDSSGLVVAVEKSPVIRRVRVQAVAVIAVG